MQTPHTLENHLQQSLFNHENHRGEGIWGRNGCGDEMASSTGEWVLETGSWRGEPWQINWGMREGLQELTNDNRGEFASEFVRGSIQTQFSSQRIQVAGAGNQAGNIFPDISRAEEWKFTPVSPICGSDTLAGRHITTWQVALVLWVKKPSCWLHVDKAQVRCRKLHPKGVDSRPAATGGIE